MLTNNLRIALRNLSKNRLFTALNLLGLASGITASLLILLWVSDELTFDNFHPNADRIYRINAHFDSGGEQQSWSSVPAPHATFAARELPECEQAVRVAISRAQRLFRYQDKQFIEDQGAVVDTGFFTMFRFPLLRGNVQNPFPNTASIVITESFARKYFGNEDPIGKVILQGEKKEPLEVSGVVADFPSNTAFAFDFCFSLERAKSRFRPNEIWKTLETNFGDFSYQTFLKLRPDAARRPIEEKITAFQHQNNQYDKTSTYTLQLLSEIHLQDASGKDTGGQTARIFLIAGILMLIIACINYINLTTASATKRAREVGVRKVNGAGKGELFGQFLTESAILSTTAFAIGVLAASQMLPLANNLADKKMLINWASPQFWTLLFSVWLLVTLFSGVYPAMVIARFSPLQAMRGRFSPAGNNKVGLRKVLVVGQFCFSVFLIAGTMVIGRQLAFIHKMNLGYNRENVFRFQQSQWMSEHQDATLDEISKMPGVTGVAMASDDIVITGSATGDTEWDGKSPEQNMMVNQMGVDERFIPLLQLQLLEGRNFLGKSDTTSYILTESAIREMGIKDPIGKRFALHMEEGHIIGVVRDFHNSSVKEKLRPTVIKYAPDWFSEVYVKINSAEASNTIAAANALWQRGEQNYPFKYEFLDETFDKLHRQELRTGQLFNWFAGVAILISCLGLFGLSTFTAEQRVKEIGVRKVLGASVVGITSLLTRDFLKLVGIAIVIATPVAYYFMQKWLADFAYRIDAQWWMFALAGATAIAIAFLTVSFQSVRAALANPVKSLRSE